MVGTKRKSAGGMEVPSKRARPDVVALTEEDLSEMSKEELVQHALELQSQLQANVATIPTPPELSAEELAEKAQKAKHILVKGIEKQMKVCRPDQLSTLFTKCFSVDAILQDEQSAIYVRRTIPGRTRLQDDAWTARLTREEDVQDAGRGVPGQCGLSGGQGALLSAQHHGWRGQCPVVTRGADVQGVRHIWSIDRQEEVRF